MGHDRYFGFATELEAAAHFIANASPANQKTTTGSLPLAALVIWFGARKAADGHPSAAEIVRALQLHIVPLIGERRIDSLRPADMFNLIDALTGSSILAEDEDAGPGGDVTGSASKPDDSAAAAHLTYRRARDLAQFIGRVYRFAFACGKIVNNPFPRGYGKEAHKIPGYLRRPAKRLPEPVQAIDDNSHEAARAVLPTHLRAGLELMADGVDHAEVNGLGEDDIDFEARVASINFVWTRNGRKPALPHQVRAVPLSATTIAALLRLELVMTRPHEKGEGRDGLLLPRPVTATAIAHARKAHGHALVHHPSGTVKPAHNLTDTFNRTLIKHARNKRDPVSLARLVGVKNPAHIATKLRSEYKRGRNRGVMRAKVSGKIFRTLRELD